MFFLLLIPCTQMQAQALHMVGWVIHMNNFAVFYYWLLTHGNAHLYNEMQPEIPSLVFCIKARGGREGGWSNCFVSRWRRRLPTMSSWRRCRMIYCVSRPLPCLIIVLGNWATIHGPSARWKGVWDTPSGISSIKHFKTSFDTFYRNLNLYH